MQNITMDFITAMKTAFIDNLDTTLIQMAVTLILFFYETTLFRHLFRRFPGNKIHKFILFCVFILFGVNILVVFLTNYILSVTDLRIKWIIIVVLILLSFIEFDRQILKDRKN
jgi:hypothetical protein